METMDFRVNEIIELNYKPYLDFGINLIFVFYFICDVESFNKIN